MRKLFALLGLLFFVLSLHSQEEEISNGREDALHVFIDCNFCDMNYIRQNMPFVNYVRDTKAAQVHVLITQQTTGSGGREYSLNFLGQLDFDGQNDTLSVKLANDATFDEKREAMVRYLKIGLLPYVAKTPLIADFNIDYTAPLEEEEVIDKWNLWVFRVGANGWFNGQELYQSLNLNGYGSADRITDKFKFENWWNFGYNEDNYDIGGEDVTVRQENYNFGSSGILAINNHWSAGMRFNAWSNTYNNMEFSYQFRPAIEYNVFDYADFTAKQIRFQYRVGNIHNQYADTTIYNEIEERVMQHSLSMAAEFRQKWGSVYCSATASQYLHDTSLKNLSIYGNISWRIVKGLQVNASAEISFIRDQISLPKGEASDIDILTRQRQLATQYSYWGSLGFSYTFGSIYSNVVNPRFGN